MGVSCELKAPYRRKKATAPVKLLFGRFEKNKKPEFTVLVDLCFL